MTQYQKMKLQDWVWYVLPGVVLFIVIIGGGGYLLRTYGYKYLYVFGAVWILLIILGGVLIIIWRIRNFAYRCTKCSKMFNVSVYDAFKPISWIAPWRVPGIMFQCPNCGEFVFGEVFKKIK